MHASPHWVVVIHEDDCGENVDGLQTKRPLQGKRPRSGRNYQVVISGAAQRRTRNDSGEMVFAYTSFTFFSGRLRIGLPVAAKIPLSTAGAATQMVGSPTPPQKSLVVTMTVSTLGNSASRMIS